MVKIRDKNELKCPKIGFKRVGWYVSTLLILPISLYAETTDNLIINGTFENGNANGWTRSGDGQVINDCCGSQYDYEFGDSGSIEQDFNLTSDSITQSMLNNGIQLESSVLVQNGEGGEGGWAYNRGGADSFTIRLQIKDADQNVLSTTTQTRITTTDIIGEYFTDSVSYSGVGSNIGSIKISGTDSNAPSTLGGANIDNVSVTMTYDPVVLTAQQTQEIAEIFEQIEEVYIEEFVYEQPVIEEVVVEEIVVETIEETISLEEEQFIEETIVLSSEVLEPEVVEEVNEEIVVEEVYEEILAEAPIEQTEEISNEEETIEETEGDTNIDESNSDIVTEETETNNESGSVETELTIEDIMIKVADKIKTTEGQLKAVSLIVAKVMSNNNKIDSYSQVNAEIFKQPVIMDRNIDTYLNQTYVDVRNIYNDKIYEDRSDWISR